MKKGIRFFILLGLILILLTGCNNNNSNLNNNPENPGNIEVPNDEPGDNPDSNDNNDNKVSEEPTAPKNNETNSVTFKEAFPDQAMDNPAAYLEQLIPGFKIGLSKEEIESLLGKPDLIENTQYEWVEREEWTYNNIDNYQLVASFTNNGRLANFKLIKELSGKGNIPKVTNKQVPGDGEVISYSELGFEGIVIGTTIDEVLNSYGEPLQSYISYDEMYGYTLALVYKGVTLNALLGESVHVQFIESNHYGTVETHRGIKIGSTTEEVIAKYGEPPYDWQEAGDLIYATEDFWFGIKFHIEDNKVTNINIYEAS